MRLASYVQSRASLLHRRSLDSKRHLPGKPAQACHGNIKSGVGCLLLVSQPGHGTILPPRYCTGISDFSADCWCCATLGVRAWQLRNSGMGKCSAPQPKSHRESFPRSTKSRSANFGLAQGCREELACASELGLAEELKEAEDCFTNKSLASKFK